MQKYCNIKWKEKPKALQKRAFMGISDGAENPTKNLWPRKHSIEQNKKHRTPRAASSAGSSVLANFWQQAGQLQRSRPLTLSKLWRCLKEQGIPRSDRQQWGLWCMPWNHMSGSQNIEEARRPEGTMKWSGFCVMTYFLPQLLKNISLWHCFLL